MLKKITYLFLFIISVILVFIFVLFSGIKIDSISLNSFSISQLYIKLDKKLIVNMEELQINAKSDTNTSLKDSLEEVKKEIHYIDEALKYFNEIRIDKIKVGEENFQILFNQENLYLENKLLNISAKIKPSKKVVRLDIYSLYLKEQDLLLEGVMKIDIINHVVTFYGNVYYKDLNAKLSVKGDENFIDFYVSAPKVKDLKFLKDFVRLHEIAEAWMYDNVEGDMRLDYLKGRVSTKTFYPEINSLEGYASIKNAKVRFDKNLETASIPRINVVYKNDNLSFDFKKAKYKQSNLHNSKVLISNLTQKGAKVLIDLNSHSILNNNIIEILKNYGITLPLIQNKGNLTSNIKLTIPFSDEKMDVKGLFRARNAEFSLGDFKFASNKAKVILDNDKIHVKDSEFAFDEMLKSNVNITIFPLKDTIEGEALIKSFDIKDKNEEIISLKNLTSDIKIDYSKDILIDVNAIDTKLNIKKELINVKANDLSKIYKNVKILNDLNISKGSATLDFYNPKKIHFDAKLQDLNFPVQKEGKQVKDINISGDILDKNITVKSNNDELEVKILDDELSIYLNGLDYNDSLLVQKDKEDNNSKPFNIYGKNSNLIFGKTFKSDSYKVYVEGKNAFFDINLIDLDFPVQNKDKTPIESMRVRGEYVNDILTLKSHDKRMNLILNDKNMNISLNDMDLLHDTNASKNDKNEFDIKIKAKGANIIVNDKFKILSDSLSLNVKEDNIILNIAHKDSRINLIKNKNDMQIDATKLSDEFINTIFNKKFFEGGYVNISSSGDTHILNSRASIHNTKIKNLTVLNNLIVFINNSPALINPLLAIPSVFSMVSNKGFNLDGYVVSKGKIDFVYNLKENYLNAYEIDLTGSSVDFAGHANLDIKNNKIYSDLNIIFLKGYSSVVKHLPIINYLFLGDDKRIDTEVNLSGKIDEPKIETNLAKEATLAPFNIIKRVLSLPAKAVEVLKEENERQKREEKVKKEEEQQQ